MLTLEMLKIMPPGIFAKGEIEDSPEGVNIINSNRKLRWVAVIGGAYDWTIYCDFAINSYEYVKDHGNKIFTEKNIKKLVECDDESFKKYRY